MKRGLLFIILILFLTGCKEATKEEFSIQKQTANSNIEATVEIQNETEATSPTLTREVCPFECCAGTEYKNKLCDADEYCDNNACKKYGCVEDSGCNANEQCSEYNCIGLSCGSCEYAENHQCLPYQCCENTDCSEGECVNHVCEVLYKVDWAPDSIEQNLLDQQLKAMRNALNKNGYGSGGSAYCRIDNTTYENLNNCDTALSSLNVNEGQVYHLVSARIVNTTSGNYDFKIINAFLIMYSKVYADYYSLVDGEAYHEKAGENLYTIRIKGMFYTVARGDLEEFANEEMTREEFLSKVIIKKS